MTASSTAGPRPTTSKGQETVKVIVRCRPLSQSEIKEGHQSIVLMHTDRGLIELKNPKDAHEPTKDFTFDAIYDGTSRQIELYDETFRDLVDSVLNGFNGTIFAYGQTGTGKTYTMEGKYDVATERGVIHNSFEHIFEHIAQSRNQQYLVRASYLEIYQEEIRDLLNKDAKARLELKERPDTGVYVKDLSSFVTKGVEEIQSVMKVGNANRSVGRTNMNEHSSRSHAIFMITVECSETGLDGENHIRVGRLNLVDLAGSERQAKTGATGERFKEATKINLSLSALGNVISSLVDGRSTHIPYRDSKLTRLLQDSLGGNSKTVMVACIGPASYNFEESLGTLRYANRAKNIKNKPKINEDPKDALLREFQEEIMRLRSMLDKRKRKEKDEDLGEVARQIERDKEAIVHDQTIVAEEKRRMLSDIEERARLLEKEREAQAAVAAKIEAMQSKLLGGADLLDHTRRQQSELDNKRKEIAEQKKREREMMEQLEVQEETVAEVEQTFTSLRQEVDVKTKKLKKLYIKLQKVRAELQDASLAHSQERQDLEQAVTDMNKELKLKLLIVENFIPSDVRDRVKAKAVWNEDDLSWNLPGARPLSQDTHPVRPSTAGQALPVEGLLTRSSGGDSGVCTSDAGTSEGRDILGKRPLSVPGLRRPMCSAERARVEKAREKLSKTRRGPPSALPTTVEGLVPEDILRFCGENVLVFSSLERLPCRVTEYQQCKIEDTLDSFLNRSEDSSVVLIDASQIGKPSRERVLSKERVQRSSISTAPHLQSCPTPSPVSEGSRTRERETESGIVDQYDDNESVDHFCVSLSPHSNAFSHLTRTPLRSIDNWKGREEEVRWNGDEFGMTSTPLPCAPSCSESSSEESEGICADYNSQQDTTSMENSFCAGFEPDPIYGRIHNMDASVDIRDFEIIGRRSVSVPRTSTLSSSLYRPCTVSSSPMSRSFFRSSEPRPTRIPKLMSHSFTSVNMSSPRSSALHHHPLSAPCGSREQLCEGYEDPMDTARSTLTRSRQVTPRRQTTMDERCLFAPSQRTLSALHSSFVSPRSNEGRLLNRPRMSPFVTDDLPILPPRAKSTVPFPSERNGLSRSTVMSASMNQSMMDEESTVRRQLSMLSGQIQREFGRVSRETSKTRSSRDRSYPLGPPSPSHSIFYLPTDEIVCEVERAETTRRVEEEHSLVVYVRRRNGFGGVKKPPVEYRISLYRSIRPRCEKCSTDSRLRRRSVHSQGWMTKNRSSEVSKPLVIRRSRCVCSSPDDVIQSIDNLQNPSLDLDWAILFAAIAFLFRIILAFID